MGNSKIVANNEVLMDITPTTATAASVLKDKIFFTADGEQASGTCDYDCDTSEATATTDEVLAGRTFGKGGKILTGTGTDRAGYTAELSDSDSATIPSGFHDGSGYVKIADTEIEKIETYLKKGVSALGHSGGYDPADGITLEEKTVDPSFSEQVVIASSGYDAISQVTVKAIPVTRVLNSSGGYTVTIG